MAIYIDLAVNNPDNGVHTGYVEAIHFQMPGENYGEPILELDVPRMRCRLRARNELQIGRRRFPIVAYAEWGGNWCWDVAKVSNEVAADIANYLRERECQAEAGWTDIYEKWETAEPFTADDFTYAAEVTAEQE